MFATPGPPAIATEFLDTREVEQFARISYTTLKRRHQEGHDTGLRKRGRRVVFHVPTLTTFLLGAARAGDCTVTGELSMHSVPHNRPPAAGGTLPGRDAAALSPFAGVALPPPDGKDCPALVARGVSR